MKERSRQSEDARRSQGGIALSVPLLQTRAVTGSDLLERAEHLALLHERLAAIDAAGGSVVLVSGEAGVGKTSLLRQFCAEVSGTRVLWGACDGLFTARPLGPLFDIAQTTPGDFADFTEAGALPHEVAMALLRELTMQRPTVLVLEDVHWADEATLDVLRLLARRAPTVPVLVLATYRDDELDRRHPLRAVLGELVRLEGTKRVKLMPLSPDGVAQLAAGHAGVDADDLYRATSGNPFFVTEVLAGTTEAIPQTIRDAVLARASRLSPEAEALLEAVAISPPEAELWLLDSLVETSGSAIDDCLDSGMLAADTDAVRFRHDLARIAIEGTIPPMRRIELHRKAVAALIEHSGERDLARLAHHAEAAGDEDAVLEFAPLAARRAADLGAHREAAAQYARALRFGARLPLAEQAALLGRRAEQCYLTAQFEDAIEAQQGAHDALLQLGDQYAVGDALRSLARLTAFAGRAAEEPDALALEAVTVLEALPPRRELAMAYGAVAQRRLAASDTDAAVSWGSKAIELAREIDDVDALVYALTSVGAAEDQAGRPEGRPKLDEALELAHRHGFEEHVGRLHFQLVHGPLRTRDFKACARALEPALTYCTEHGLETWRHYLLACRASMELQLGRWEQAAESSLLVLDGSYAAPVAHAWALATLGRLRARRGDPDVFGPLDEADELTRDSAEIFRIGPVATARAEAAWLAGDDAAVEAMTDNALALAVRHSATWETCELAFWRRQAGVEDELDLPGVNPYALALAGKAAEAAERWRAIGCTYEAAIVLADSDAVDDARGALTLLRELGAEPAATLSARRLRARGERGLARGPRASTLSNPAGLTPRELEVLRFVAQGLRNAEIAGELVLSERTVDHHVAAILRKLQARTRAEAGAEAVRRGLVDLSP
jgi:DNA-binding NarL/FixJ family response regulator